MTINASIGAKGKPGSIGDLEFHDFPATFAASGHMNDNWRSPEETAMAVDTMSGLPITLNHPEGWDVEDMFVMDPAKVLGYTRMAEVNESKPGKVRISGTMRIYNKNRSTGKDQMPIIKDIQAGKLADVSIGFMYEAGPRSGTNIDGRKIAYEETEVRGTHLSILKGEDDDS